MDRFALLLRSNCSEKYVLYGIASRQEGIDIFVVCLDIQTAQSRTRQTWIYHLGSQESTRV